MTPRLYQPAPEGQWIRPIRRGYRVACCDCGLIHVIDIRVHQGQVEFQARRDNRATAKLRQRKQRAAKTKVKKGGSRASAYRSHSEGPPPAANRSVGA